MSSVTLQSPAKLNLFLRVLNKRADGFHNIETLFERIDLCDTIRFQSKAHGDIHIECDHLHVPTGPKNLIYKAARLLQEHHAVSKGLNVKITKRIPVAAGLAGGSSNAASALLALNQLWQLRLSQKKLLTYARSLGSDVAFFMHNYSWGLGTERGDKIKRINIKTKLWHVIVVPRVKMYSGDVYRAMRKQSQLTKKKDDVNILLRYLKGGDVLKVGTVLTNDLESAVLRLRPQLVKLKERLKAFDTCGVLISGSGPCVYGLTISEKEARDAQSILSKRFSQVFVVKTL